MDRGWPGGPAVDGAIVTLEGPVSARQTTSANGEFSFHDVPDGSYRLSVAIPPDRAGVSAPAATAVTLTAETSCVNVDVTAPSTARVTGTVVDPAGAPAAGVFVELFPAPYDQWAGGYAPLDGISTARAYGGTTAADGSFAIEAHEGVRYRVLVEEGHRIVGRAEFVAGDGPLEIGLVPPR